MDRRYILRMSALVGARLVHPYIRAAAPPTELSPEMNVLSAYMSSAAHRELPGEVVEQAKFYILDTFAAMISGSELPCTLFLNPRYLKAHTDKGVSTIVGSTRTSDPMNAALANGVMAHSDETDDSHGRSRSHPGCAVVTAALATGEKLKINGTHFLRAVTLGYDVSTRVLMAMGGLTFSYESHKSSHSIAGIFGAAAA